MKNLFYYNFQQILIFGGIILVTFIIAFVVNYFFYRLITRSSKIIKNDPTNYQFLRHLLRGLIFLFGFSLAIYTVPGLRAFANSLLAGAGILAIAIGFASQHALSNIISGFFIVLFRPFRINDRLTIQGNMSGIVEDITLRHTVIRNFENQRIIIPNAIISDEIVVNSDFADGKICKWVDINISYNSNIDKAKKLIQEEACKHPLHIDTRIPEEIEAGEPEIVVRVIALGEFAVNLRAWVWAKNANDSFVMSCDLYESIKKRFENEGIEIPLAYHKIITK